MASSSLVLDRDRPSAHGAILGEFLSALEKAGRTVDPNIADPCATCAFRQGSMPNQMGGTTLAAFHCTIGTDPAPFGCHHRMKDGTPTHMCAGYAAARLAPFEYVKAELEKTNARLADLPPDDKLRAEFDAWVATIDPDNRMDDYARSRAYARQLASV
jgi:hypothetical protein